MLLKRFRDLIKLKVCLYEAPVGSYSLDPVMA
jgi:hypothetical protein